MGFFQSVREDTIKIFFKIQLPVSVQGQALREGTMTALKSLDNRLN